MLATTIVIAILVTVAVSQAPNVVFTVNPQPTQGMNIAATCPPTVVSVDSAFLCYHTNGQGDAVQYVNPSQPGTGYTPGMASNLTNRFLYPPIPLTKMHAITYSIDPQNSDAALYSATEGNLKVVNRYGSTAAVVYGSDIQVAFVPVGVNQRTGNFDTINAFNVSATNEQDALIWSKDFTLPTNFPLTTQLSTPIYYRGQLMVLAGTTFYVFDAATGTLIRHAMNPCNWTATTQVFNMYLITFGEDQNGSLDAFILIGNTTTPGSGKPQTSVCRVSHNTGLKEWGVSYPNSEVHVLDVIGSNSTVLITGWFTTWGGSQELVTWSMNAQNGNHQDTLARMAQDQFSFPAVLPQPIGGCSETIVLQVGGKLAAYCTGSYVNAKWTSDFPCDHRAAINETTNTIACVSRGASIHLLDFDGNMIWINDQVSAIFGAQIVAGYVWVVDLDATLWGLTMTASATPLPPPYIPVPSPDGGGLGAGAVTGIVFTVFIVGGALGAAAVAYIRFSKRRAARTEALNEDQAHPVAGSYGGIA